MECLKKLTKFFKPKIAKVRFAEAGASGNVQSLSAQEEDSCLLKFHDGKHVQVPVEWFCDIPFAAPHLPDTRCRLLPNGDVDGASYVIGWYPASETMRNFYNKTEVPLDERT